MNEYDRIDTFKHNLFDMVVENLYDSQLVDARDRVEAEIIKRRGYKDGRTAGSWVIDGNTTEEAIEAFQRGIREGDPMVLDLLPQPSLGGEFADNPTWEDVLRDEGITIDEDGNDVLYQEYDMAFQQGVHDEVMAYGNFSTKV